MQGDRKKHSTFCCLPERTPLACNVTLTIPKSQSVDFCYSLTTMAWQQFFCQHLYYHMIIFNKYIIHISMYHVIVIYYYNIGYKNIILKTLGEWYPWECKNKYSKNSSLLKVPLFLCLLGLSDYTWNDHLELTF